MIKGRRGTSELVAVATLVLISVVLGTAFYVVAKSLIDSNTYLIMKSLRVAEANLGSYVIVDSFYISNNHTLVLYLYTNYNFPAVFDTIYINGTKIPNTNYLEGFNKPVKIGSLNRFALVVNLSPGYYSILLTGKDGVKAYTNIEIR